MLVMVKNWGMFLFFCEAKKWWAWLDKYLSQSSSFVKSFTRSVTLWTRGHRFLSCLFPNHIVWKRPFQHHPTPPHLSQRNSCHSHTQATTVVPVESPLLPPQVLFCTHHLSPSFSPRSRLKWPTRRASFWVNSGAMCPCHWCIAFIPTHTASLFPLHMLSLTYAY